MQNTNADRIREYLRSAYIDPARLRHDPTVRIVAGDVLKALRLQNRAPAVCQVLRGRKFLAENDLILEKQVAPPSGLSTTAAFIYRLSDKGESPAVSGRSGWQSLRGIAKAAFAKLGGGESFLRDAREHFYGSGPDPAGDDEKAQQ